MINLIVAEGKDASGFFLRPEQLSDFMALVRTIVSGKVLFISTEFRSDLFYKSAEVHHEAIIKAWMLYSDNLQENVELTNLTYKSGDKDALTFYFQTICQLAGNWYQYMVYRKAFYKAFSVDKNNALANTVAQCDQHLVSQCGIDRLALIGPDDHIDLKYTDDNYALAMLIKNNQLRSN